MCYLYYRSEHTSTLQTHPVPRPVPLSQALGRVPMQVKESLYIISMVILYLKLSNCSLLVKVVVVVVLLTTGSHTY